jgi:hypothetical protein
LDERSFQKDDKTLAKRTGQEKKGGALWAPPSLGRKRPRNSEPKHRCNFSIGSFSDGRKKNLLRCNIVTGSVARQ